MNITFTFNSHGETTRQTSYDIDEFKIDRERCVATYANNGHAYAQDLSLVTSITITV